MVTTTLQKTWNEAKWWLGYVVIGTAIEVLLTVVVMWLGGLL